MYLAAVDLVTEHEEDYDASRPKPVLDDQTEYFHLKYGCFFNASASERSWLGGVLLALHRRKMRDRRR